MAGTPQIRVMIVDDHEMLRRGLVYFLEAFDDLVYVGEAACGADAIELCAVLRPDVILMDMMMPDLPGDEVTARVLARWPETKVVALSSFHDQELVVRAMEAGANGYLLKGTTAKNLADAVRKAYRGEITLSPEATMALMQRARRQGRRQAYGLTDREKEVLALLTEGLSNAEISERLHITVPTAKFHVRGILSKLGVSNRTEAAVLALEQDLI